jgi:uncharacterized membrane protein
MTTQPNARVYNVPASSPSRRFAFILFLLTGLFVLLLALLTAGFGVFAVVEDGSSNRVVHHSDLPVFLGVLAAIFVVLGGIGLVYSLGSFAIKRGSKGGSLLALLALLFNLLITVGGIVAGIIIAVANSNDSDAVMAGIITAAVGLIATFLLGVLLVLLVFAMRSPKSSDPTPT